MNKMVKEIIIILIHVFAIANVITALIDRVELFFYLWTFGHVTLRELNPYIAGLELVTAVFTLVYFMYFLLNFKIYEKIISEVMQNDTFE